MNPAIRRVALGIVVLFVALTGQLTYLQVVRAKSLADNPQNVRVVLRDLNRPRGPIVTADGVVVAESHLTSGDVTQQRVYPQGPLFAQIVGYQSIVYGSTGVEQSYDADLTGRDLRQQLRNLGGLLGSAADRTGTVVLTVDSKEQALAREALGEHHGSVVVLDVHTGGIVAMYSNPTYDPNVLASHDTKTVEAVQKLLLASPENPELPRAYREIYPPGSTYKTVTAAVALDTGTATPSSTYPVLRELPLPQTTSTLQNFGGEACGGTLVEGYVHSCNTTFGQVGLDLGNLLATDARQFGVGTDPPPLDLTPGAVGSKGPAPGTFRENKPGFAQAAIGQGQVAVTPLEMAMVAAAVANDGVMMVPHVGDRVLAGAGDSVVRRVQPRVWMRAMSPATALEMRSMMRQVVERGTGTAAQIPGIPVAGKTGTAQTTPGAAPHAWFIAFAPADHPRYAVAVLVEHGGSMGNEATGGAVAAPIAARMLQGVLAG